MDNKYVSSQDIYIGKEEEINKYWDKVCRFAAISGILIVLGVVGMVIFTQLRLK